MKKNTFLNDLDNLHLRSPKQIKKAKLFWNFILSLMTAWLIYNNIPLILVIVVILPIYKSFKVVYKGKMSFNERKIMLFIELMRYFIPMLFGYAILEWLVPASRAILYLNIQDIFSYIF